MSHPHRIQRRGFGPSGAAFTLIEVLATLLVLVLGIASAVGLVIYGMHLAKLAMGQATGMATAMSVAIDHRPLLPADAFWNPSATATGESSGYVNGFWVERVEDPGEVVAPGVQSALVRVDVFETLRGTAICSYQERILRRQP